MARTKQKRITLEKDGISKKAMKYSSPTYWGNEPTWEPKNLLLSEAESELETEIQIGKAFNWYNAIVDDSKLKEYLIKYVELNYPDDVEFVKTIPERSCHTFGSLARMISRGANVPKIYIDKFKTWIRQMKEEMSIPKIKKEKFSGGIQRDPKVSEFIAKVDEVLDKCRLQKDPPFPTKSMEDFLIIAGATKNQRESVSQYFTKLKNEMESIYDSLKTTQEQRTEIQKDIIAAYSGFGFHLRKNYEWLTGKATVKHSDIVPVVKTRKKKEKTPKQILKNFVCRDSSPDLQISSIKPEKILGAEQLIVFNTESKKIAVFHAKNSSGLTVNRRSIDNYDVQKSKVIHVRKPVEFLPKFMKMGKVEFKKFIETGSPVKTGRLNENTLLLKIG